MKCKDCKFFSGVQCHGHGDYWGECNIYDIVYPNHNERYIDWNIRVNDDECYNNEFREIYNKEIEKIKKNLRERVNK